MLLMAPPNFHVWLPPLLVVMEKSSRISFAHCSTYTPGAQPYVTLGKLYVGRNSAVRAAGYV